MVTCVVADAQNSAVEAIADRLAAAGFAVVATAGDGEAALAAIEAHSPTIAVLGLEMPGLNGVEVARRVRDLHPSTATILYARTGEPELVMEAADAGIRGLVSKDPALDALLRAVELAASGTGFVDPLLAPALVRGGATSQTVPLSQRERDILRLLADGRTNAEIGQELFISADTVRTYLRRAMGKLEADNRTHAVAIALRESFIL